MRHCWGTITMPHTRSGQDLDRSRNMRTLNRRLGPLLQHPPSPLPGRHHTTTSRESTHNNTKGSDLNKPPQNPGLGTPAKGHCTRYAALHPLRGIAPVTWRCTRTEGVQCLQIGCNAYRSGARPPSQAHMRTCPKGRPRTRQAWLGPAAQSKQLAGPGGAVQTAGWARGRQGLTGLRDDEPSGRLAAQTTSGPLSARLAAQTTSGPPSGRLASLARHKARARGAHTTRPGPAAPNSAEDPGLDSKSDQSIHHEVREGLERGLRLALRQRSQGSDRVAGPGARQLARLLQHVMAAQLLDDRGQGLVGG